MAGKRIRLLALIGPGILVAATGVGAGDLATGAFTGSELGAAILWAVLLGALFKFVLNEGLARWQLATGDTLLEGASHHFGRPARWFFMVYLVIWSFLVGAALMSAVGVTAHAIFPICGNLIPLESLAWLPGNNDAAQLDKILYGLLHSALAVVLIKLGGYRLFEKIMSVCIVVMFVVVISTAVALRPPLNELASGLFVPQIPKLGSGGLGWTVALMGGVGGTVTVLCYGYWIREEGREGPQDLKTCRIDLAAGYGMTALFGLAMVVIGSQVHSDALGAKLVVDIAQILQTKLGHWGTTMRWAFLIGAWGAVFSSLLGVWQSVPYLFADLWSLSRSKEGRVDRHQIDTRSLPYQAYLWFIAVVPIAGLTLVDFKTLQKVNAIVGALFIPILAVVLLTLNGRSKWVGRQYRNSWLTMLVLAAALLFFLVAGWLNIQRRFFSS